MVRCNNCYTLFKNDKALARLVEASDEKENKESFLYDPCADLPSFEDWDSEEIYYENFLGCPHCLTDEYLMDLDDEDQEFSRSLDLTASQALDYIYEEFKHRAYELYKANWLKARNIDPFNFDDDEGQAAECYACYSEFLDNEFQEEECMESILPEREFDLWKTFVG